MNPHLKIAIKYFRYLARASNGKGHGIHSPFIFRFVQQVLNDKKKYPEYTRIEKLRKRLYNNHALLLIDDLGAGSAITASNNRTVSSIAKNAAKPAKYGQLLFRMVRFFQPQTIIELGTSLGITTIYLAKANPESSIITMEGAQAIAGVAKENFNQLAVKNIKQVPGNFDETLPPLLDKMEKVDFVFIDGNHRQEPTVQYFSWLLPKITNNSVLVFDDIHWSEEMENAWLTIQQHPAVTATIDLFFIGIVFFRKEFKQKEHFIIRY